ncbi:hypothetical protein [Bradyrhizobium retamae]|uniref:ABC transporter domain-containing protein n=1 Tax=Bradyrhizobium retamae TaxID=1300035 RepID=A0A0R3NBU4_9BRAD|nr:hypothetical protein CQ13_38525 [Bradyrhizobium retamae]
MRRRNALRRPEPEPEPIEHDEVVELRGIAPLLDRSPSHLSGGERQRVPIGQAVSHPGMLVMVEPLAALHRCSLGVVGELFNAIDKNRARTRLFSGTIIIVIRLL